MKKYNINGIDYELMKDFRDGFDLEEVTNKLTDYFTDYDYVVGDWAYSKLRLKGFYDEKNKKAKKINNYKFIEDYLKKNCANDCRHFVIKKVKE